MKAERNTKDRTKPHNQCHKLLLFLGYCPSNAPCVSQGPICSDSSTTCHTEIEVADQTTQSQCTDTGPTSPCCHPKTPGVWQGDPLWYQLQLHSTSSPGNEGFDPSCFLQSKWTSYYLGTDTGPTIPCYNPKTPGVWQGGPLWYRL